MAKQSSQKRSGIVYSTRHGETCPTCGAAVASCRCPKQGSSPGAPRDGIVRVSRQTKGRKGKGVTLVTGLALDRAELAELARELKQKCGSGGTLRDGVIEIQGDHRDSLLAELQARGYKVKKAGG